MPDLDHSLPLKPQEPLTPNHLASLWKKSGQFDKLRKQLLSDFLTSEEKDRLVTELDTILPELLKNAQPPISRIPRKDRPNHVLEALERNKILEQELDKQRDRLTKKGEKGSTGLGRTLERELRSCARKYTKRTDELEEEEPDSQEDERPEEDVPKAVPSPIPNEVTAAPTKTREPSVGPNQGVDSTITSNAQPQDSLPPSSASDHLVGVDASTEAPIKTASQDVEMKSAVLHEPESKLGISDVEENGR